MKRNITVRGLGSSICLLGFLLCGPVEAATNSLVVDNGIWNTATTWSLGTVPASNDTVVISAGYTVKVSAAPLSAYTGDLIIESNATLNHATTDRLENCMPSGTGRVFLYDGAEIIGQRWANDGQTTTIPNDFVLSGNSVISRTSYNVKVYFTGEWSGTGGVTFNCRTYATRVNDTFNFAGSVPNTYTGGTIVQAYLVDANLDFFYANADGCFGTGDVTVNADMELRLGGSTTDTIDDTATLTLNDDATINLFSNNETVNKLFVQGVQAPAGTYGRIGLGTVDYEVSYILGNGVLTVTTAPPADSTAPTIVSIDDNHFGGPIYEDWPLVYTITFDESIDTATVAADNFVNIGTATGTFGALTPTVDSVPLPTVYTLEFNPSSAGTIVLQVVDGSTTIKDLAGNALVAPVTDSAITVNPGLTPPATFTGAVTEGNVNDWITAGNWDTGFVPFAGYSVVIGAGKAARSDAQGAPTYSGGLTLQAGSSLMIGGGGNSHTRPDGPNAFYTSSVTMNDGSSIVWRHRTDDPFPPIAYSGDVTFEFGSNESGNSTYEFDGGLSGTGTFNLYAPINNTYHRLTSANSVSGAFVIDSNNRTDNKGPRVEAEAAGCFGTCDITVGRTCGLRLETADTIDDGAVLTLLGEDSVNTTAKIQFSSAFTETVGQLWLDYTVGDGTALEQLPSGDYTATTSPAKSPASGGAVLDIDGLPIISGSGTLTVTSGPVTGTMFMLK